MKNTKGAIHDVERDVLDQHHKQFDVLLRPDDVAIRFILMAYGDALRHYERVRGEGALFRGQRYWVQSFAHGLSHCFRWLAAEPSRQILIPAASPEQVYQEAKKLLLWSAQYEALAADHSAWSRGYIQADIDETAKTITFSHPGNADAALFARQTEALQALMDTHEQQQVVFSLLRRSLENENVLEVLHEVAKLPTRRLGEMIHFSASMRLWQELAISWTNRVVSTSWSS